MNLKRLFISAVAAIALGFNAQAQTYTYKEV